MRNQKLINQKISESLKAKYKNKNREQSVGHVKHLERIHNDPIIKQKRILSLKKINEAKPIEQWSKGRLRKFLLDKNDWKCSECGYSRVENNSGPFQVHHIDGNEKNRNLQNLKILCYNCHWFTENWGHRGRKHTQETRNKMSLNYILKRIK